MVENRRQTASRPRPLRVLVMTNTDLLPPASLDGLSEQEQLPFRAGYNVRVGLAALGHSVVELGVDDELAPIGQALAEVKPHVVFNLVEQFLGRGLFCSHVVSYLELNRAAYTGCNPRGLVLARDKALSKKILRYHRFAVPRFRAIRRSRMAQLPPRCEFPVIVKSLSEQGSYGISEASVVRSQERLKERVSFVHDQLESDAIVEQYVEGREIYASVYGNERLTTLPPWELKIQNLRADAPNIATSQVKWNVEYQKRRGVELAQAIDLDAAAHAKIDRHSKRIYRALGLSGYARIDFRLRDDGKLFFLEANPNPDITDGDEFASAAKAAGLSYDRMLQKLLTLGMSYRAA